MKEPRGVPDPATTPVLSVWPETGRIMGLGRSATYAAVKDGSIPAVKIGSRWVVPTAALRRLLALDAAERAADG